MVPNLRKTPYHIHIDIHKSSYIPGISTYFSFFPRFLDIPSDSMALPLTCQDRGQDLQGEDALGASLGEEAGAGDRRAARHAHAGPPP